MSHSNPTGSARRSTDHGVVGRQDSSAAEGPFSPAGLKVLVVDDDPMCLKVVSAMLKRCNYEVVTQSNGQEALALLRQRHEEGRDQFDLVLSDVYMPDMDGFRLLEAIGLELELPVIMMSSDGDTNVVLRGVTHGAVDFLIKPVRIEELRNVWQHVVRRRSIAHRADDSGIDCDGDSRTHGTKRKDTDTGRGEHESASGAKKPRVVWSVEMHQQFVNAVNTLGIDKAVPKRILDLMNVEGLTRENVASHLQKYRLYLKRVEGVSAGKGGRVPKPPVVERMAAAAAETGPAPMAAVAATSDAAAAAAAAQQQQHAAAAAAAAAAAVPMAMSMPQTTAAAALAAPMPMPMMPGGYPAAAAAPPMMGMAPGPATAQMAVAWQQQQQAMAMQAAAMQAAAASAAPMPHAMPVHPYATAPMQTAAHPMMAPAPQPGAYAPHPMAAGPYCAMPGAPMAAPGAAAPVMAAPYATGSHGSLTGMPPGTAAYPNGTAAAGPGADVAAAMDPASAGHHPGLPPPGHAVDYASHEDEALLPSLGAAPAMPEEAPLSESLLHDLPVAKHEEGDQEFYSIFNIQQNGDGAAVRP